MLKEDPQQRISLAEIFTHPWIRQFETQTTQTQTTQAQETPYT
jgi:hypothetical protein